MMNDKRKLTTEELEAHLDEQLAFLEASCNSFDTGFEGEAKRLAVSLRVLLHDTKNSKSLLGQLNKKDISFRDTAFEYDPKNKLTHGGLIFIATGQPKTRYVAMLDDIPDSNNKDSSFNEWWDSPVFVDNQRRELSRKELVLIAANQDGGAHVDSSLNEKYASLSKDNSLGWISNDGQGETPMDGPERAAIRQIAHETLKTLKKDYFKKPNHEAGVIFGGMSFTEGVPAELNKKQPRVKTVKIGRNEPCPCGSGKKYKRCHGSI